MIYSESKVRGYIVFFLIFSFLVVFTTFIFLLLNGKTISTGGGIVDKGIIRINSVPENVDVYINGEKKSLTGKVIQNLDLGEAEVRLEKEGFESWEKTINIESGFVEDIFAQLFPVELNLQQVSSLNIDKISYSEDANYAYFTVLNSEIIDEIGIWKISFESNFLDFNESSSPEKVASISATQLNNLKNNSYFLNLSQDRDRLILDIPAAESLLSYDTNSTDTFEDLVKKIGFYPTKYSWFDDSKSLLIETSNILYELNLDSFEKDLVAITQNVDEQIIYCATNNKIYYIDPYAKDLYRYENGRPEVAKDVPDFSRKSINNLYCSKDNSDIIYATNTNGLYFLDLKNLYAEIIIKNSSIGLLDISLDGSVLLFATEDSLYSYRIEAISSKPLYKSTLSDLGILKPNVNVSISTNGINIEYIELIDSVPAGFEVSISDTDGENLTKLLTEVIEPNSIAMSKNGAKLYLVLDDSTNEVTQNKTLYTIELK